MGSVIYLLSIIGFVLSAYFLYVKKKQQTSNYRALCDISETISCSKAANSRYSNIFLLPNAFFGMIFYLLVFALNYLNLFMFVFYLAVFSSLFSVCLIYISIRTKIACPVCILAYIVNFLILWFSYVSI